MTKQQRQEKQELLTWLQEHEQYNLYGWSTENPPLRTLRRLKVVVLEIIAALDQAADRLGKLQRFDCGVGDTDTDEAIAGDFYDRFHFRR